MSLRSGIKTSKQNTNGTPNYSSNNVPEHTKLILEVPLKLDKFPAYYFLSALFPSSEHIYGSKNPSNEGASSLS